MTEGVRTVVNVLTVLCGAFLLGGLVVARREQSPAFPLFLVAAALGGLATLIGATE